MSQVIVKKPESHRFGRYQLVRRIGFGGMGEVWLALLPGPGGIHKVCVVKKILPHLAVNRTFVERFFDEAKVVMHLAHGNISQVFEMGREGDEYFMAMEYVEGKTLARLNARLRQRGLRFPLPVALYLGIRACDALAYAHRKTDPSNGRPLHVVHRDVSPSNLIISYEGEAKIIDFGAAQSAVKGAQTGPRMVIGNLAYMSPEQARKRPVDGRADVYSMSVVLWELLSWQPMPTDLDKAERWRRAAYPSFEPPSRFQPDLPREIDDIIMKGLAIDAQERLPSAEVLRDALQMVLSQLAPDTSQSTLAALMRENFAAEASEDRALVAQALSLPTLTAPPPLPPSPPPVAPLPDSPVSLSLPEPTFDATPATRHVRSPLPPSGSGTAQAPGDEEDLTVTLTHATRARREFMADREDTATLTEASRAVSRAATERRVQARRRTLALVITVATAGILGAGWTIWKLAHLAVQPPAPEPSSLHAPR